MRSLARSTSPPASTTNTMASSGLSPLRARRHPAPAIAQREGLTGPPFARAIRRWAAAAVLVVLFTPLRSLNLCAAVVLGLAPFLASSPIGQFVTRSLSYARLLPARLAAVVRLECDEQLSQQDVERLPLARRQAGQHAFVSGVVGFYRFVDQFLARSGERDVDRPPI